MSDPFRDRMAEAIAGHLDVTFEEASAAMDAAWEATKDVRTGAPPSWQPNLSDPGQALARRVQEMLEREFDGEELFPVVVVVQDPRSRRIGLAATMLEWNDVEFQLQLGMGAARRTARQYTEPL